MIDSYATLKTSIAAFLHRADLTSIIPEFIADAEARIYNELRIRAMEAAFTGVTASGVVALPAGFLAWKYLTVEQSGNQKIEYKDTEWIYTNYPTREGAGTPVFYAIEGDNVIFAPYPANDLNIAGRYYKRLPALSDSNTTNWFIENEPGLLRYAALCEAAPYLGQDERVGLWEGKYQAALARIKSTERKQNTYGSQLSMRAG